MNPRFPRLLSGLLVLAAFTRGTAQPAPPPPPLLPSLGAAPAFPLETYADLGFVFGDNGKFGQLGWTAEQFEAFVNGLRDSFHGKAHHVDTRVQALHAEVGRRLEQVAREAREQTRNFFKDPAKLRQYMKEACKAYNMELSDSGLGFAVRAQSGSVRPEPGDTVVISCRVRAADGKTEFPQLSLDHHSVKIADLLPGPAEGVQMLTVGSTAMLIVPPALSYGDGAWPEGVAPGMPLFYLISLEQVVPGS